MVSRSYYQDFYSIYFARLAREGEGGRAKERGGGAVPYRINYYQREGVKTVVSDDFRVQEELYGGGVMDR